MPTLPLQSDLIAVFGDSNITQWGDVNNTGDSSAIATRCTLMIARAYRYVSGRLNKRYNIAALATLPGLVFDTVVDKAGIELYKRPRGLVDGDPAFQMINSLALEVETRLEQMLSGILDLTDHPNPPIESIGANNDTIPYNHEYVHDLLRLDDPRFSTGQNTDAFYPVN